MENPYPSFRTFVPSWSCFKISAVFGKHFSSTKFNGSLLLKFTTFLRTNFRHQNVLNVTREVSKESKTFKNWLNEMNKEGNELLFM
jgi:hypothetical protein